VIFQVEIVFLWFHSIPGEQPDIAIAIAVGADGVEIRNCDFLQNAADENFKICIDDGGANVSDRLLVEGCTFVSVDTANTHAISFGAAQDRVIIRNNFFSGHFEATTIGGAGVITNCLIENNYIQNIDNEADQCILLGANSTGCVVRNLVGSYLAGNVTTNISCGTKCMLCENYSVDGTAGDVQGVLDPIATT
jgi:pectate lyase